MKYILSIILSSVLSLLLIVTAWLQVPIKWVSAPTTLGSTVTTISSSDTMSDFPTSYNATINSLNNTKLEISAFAATTSNKNLAEVGTITTGTWNASTIQPAYGGTGSTTLQQYAVLLGSSTNPIHAVSGLGSSGQVLVSNGIGLKPSWQSVSVNQSLDYTWSGYHIFSYGLFATRASTTHATTTTLSVNGVNYRWPSSNNASSTVLSNDGSGNLLWILPEWRLITATTTTVSLNTATVTLPFSSRFYKVYVSVASSTNLATQFYFNGDHSASYGYSYYENTTRAIGSSATEISMFATGTTSPLFFDFDIDNSGANGAGRRTFVTWKGLGSVGAMYPVDFHGSGVYANTSPITSIQFISSGGSYGAGTIFQVYGSNN
jgi:hypothetical protein